MLVVVAIIGVFSLITIPAVMNYARSSTIRGASWQFMSDVRRARTLAITQSTPVTLTLDVGAAPAAPAERGRYTATGAHNGNFVRRLDRTVYFHSSNFDGDQIVFLPNGTIQNMPEPAVQPLIVMKSDFEIPNNVVTFRFSQAGSVKPERSTE